MLMLAISSRLDINKRIVLVRTLIGINDCAGCYQR
jgi:hypothetical protein